MQAAQEIDSTHTPELLEYLKKRNSYPKHIESSNNSVVSVVITTPPRKRRNTMSNGAANKIVVKEIKHKKANEHCEQCNDLKNEVEKLNLMDHRSIIKLHDNMIHEFPMSCAIFLPKALEDLFDYMLKYSAEDNLKSIKICFYQIAQAIQYLHEEKNMVHGDIKPENIFVFSNTDFRLADFGFCKEFEGYTKREEFLKKYTSRSLKYLPPEFVDCLEQPSINLGLINEFSSDVFGLGVSLFQVIFKQCPYFQETEFFCYSPSQEKIQQSCSQIVSSNNNKQAEQFDFKSVNLVAMKNIKVYQYNISNGNQQSTTATTTSTTTNSNNNNNNSNSHKYIYNSPVSTNNTTNHQNSPTVSSSPQLTVTKKKPRNKRKYYHKEDKLYKILYSPNDIDQFWDYFHPEFKDMTRNSDLTKEDFEQLKDLIQKSITPMHYLRLDIQGFLAHPFFSDLFDDQENSESFQE